MHFEGIIRMGLGQKGCNEFCSGQLVVGETMIGETTIAAGTMIAGETIAVDGTTTASGEMMIVADAMMTDALILSRGWV